MAVIKKLPKVSRAICPSLCSLCVGIIVQCTVLLGTNSMIVEHLEEHKVKPSAMYCELCE